MGVDITGGPCSTHGLADLTHGHDHHGTGRCFAIHFINTNLTNYYQLLPYDTGRPRLIRLRIPGRVDAANNTTDWAIPLTEYLGENTAFSSREITRNVGGEPLRYPLRVFFRDNFLEDGSRKYYQISVNEWC